MDLENLVLDARDPATLGRFWEALLGGTTLTDEPDAFETRISVEGGPALDLCLQRVPEPVTPSPRLHLDLAGGPRQAEVVERALGLGARHLDIGQGDVPWVVLADPEGNPFCVMEERPEYAVSGPVAALPLDSADPSATPRSGPSCPAGGPWRPACRRPCATPRVAARCSSCAPSPGPRGPARTACTSTCASRPGDDPDRVARRIGELGGRELDPGWGELPWRVFADPSGNELCVLPARTT